jgi:hypothetical protein
MIVERDNYGFFHVRGTVDAPQGSWHIQVWLKGSDQDGPEDHRFMVSVDRVFSTDIDAAERDAVLALIDQWEDRLPLMVASPIKPPL